MIDIANYKRAIHWLQRGLAELQRDPDNSLLQLGVLQSFEVTHNLSESMLRQAYLALSDDNDATFLSTRELIWRASEEGLILSTRKQWLQYALALESMRETCTYSLEGNTETASELLSQFAQELHAFASEKRLAAHA